MDDKQLIKEFLRGNEKCFDQLVLNHEMWVKSMILGMVKNKEDSEDIAQDVFVKIYFALNRFRFESEFKTWMYRIVVNKVNNYFRKQKLRNYFSGELNEDIYEEKNINSKNENKIFQFTHKLPKVQRSVVMLRVYQDLPFKIIGEVLSITENSAKVSFHKAKTNLKKQFKEKYGNE